MFLTDSGMTYFKSQQVANTGMVRTEVPSLWFNDNEFASLPGKNCLYVTGMQLRIRHWDGRPVLAGNASQLL